MKPKDLLHKAIEGKCLSGSEIEVIAAHPQCSKLYAQKVLNGRFPLGEESIKTSAAQSYLYAKDIIGGPWKDGEDTISKDAHYSLQYAQNVLHGKFKKGEKAIASEGCASFFYAKSLLARFEKGEKAILRDCIPNYLVEYSKNIMKARWPEAEERIIQDSDSACEYACAFEFRWPEAEPAILQYAESSVLYATTVIKGRWEEAEGIISTCPGASSTYAKSIGERFQKGEDIIIMDAIKNNDYWTLRDYINNVLNGERWDKLENFIENCEESEEKILKLITEYSNSVPMQLPDFIHNRMLAIAISNAEDWNVKRYFDSLEEREEAEKLRLVERFSLDRLREILSGVE